MSLADDREIRTALAGPWEVSATGWLGELAATLLASCVSGVRPGWRPLQSSGTFLITTMSGTWR